MKYITQPPFHQLEYYINNSDDEGNIIIRDQNTRCNDQDKEMISSVLVKINTINLPQMGNHE